MCRGDRKAERQEYGAACLPLCEALEPRQMLSASLQDGVLRVDGTREADFISIGVDRTDRSRYVVNVNGNKTVFARRGIERVRLLGRRGDDVIVVNQLQGKIDPEPQIRGGAGADRVVHRRREPRIDNGNTWAVVQLSAPTALTATSVLGTQVELSWTDNNATEVGFIMERAEAGGPFVEVARLGADVTVYGDAGLKRDVVYAYRVRAYGAGGVSPASEAVETRTLAFRVFDGTVYTGRPDTTAWGLEPIYIAYSNGFSATNSAIYDEPDETATRLAARRAAEQSGIMVIDIEHWPMDVRAHSEAEVRASLEKFSRIIGWIRDERPELKLGLFAVVPWPSYRTALYGDAAQTAAWQAANDFLRPLAEQVDIIFPELYSVELDGESWSRYAQAQIQEARRYGKPVYVFLWDRAYTWEAVGAEQLRLQLATARRLADGAVLWGGWLRGQVEPWNEQVGWWGVAGALVGSPDGPSTAPEGLAASRGGYGSIDLSWRDRSDNEDGFVIERSSDGVSFIPIAVVGPDVTRYHDDELIGQSFFGTVSADTPRYRGGGAAGMTFHYRVRAHNQPGDSAASNVASAEAWRDASAATEAETMDGIFKGHYIWTSFASAWTAGGWFRYGAMDFGAGVSSFSVNLAVGDAEGKRIELRLDDPAGQLAGVLDVQSTGGASVWQVQSTAVSDVSGVHDLYLVFPQAWLGHLDWFSFGR